MYKQSYGDKQREKQKRKREQQQTVSKDKPELKKPAESKENKAAS